ncbi:MAG: hypothetical protein R6U37_08720 [Dehalococcoidia bacterium]
MNTRKSRLITLVTIVLIIILAVPAAFAAAGGISLDDDASTQIGVDGIVLPDKIDGYQIPKRIGGFPVIAVTTNETDPSFPKGEVIIHLASTKKGIPAPEIVPILKSLPKEWSIGLAGNSLKDETPREIRGRIHETQDEWSKYVEQRGYVPTSSGFSEMEASKTENSRGGDDNFTRTYSMIRNMDVDTYTVNGLIVRFKAPTLGNNHKMASMLLLNGHTSANDDIQSGLLMAKTGQQPTGYVVYADSDSDKLITYPGVLYYSGHTYRHMLLKSSSGGWYLQAWDMDNGNFYTKYDQNCAGSKLALHEETSVWWETLEYTNNWYIGWTSKVPAHHALQSIPGYGWYGWFTENKECWELDPSSGKATAIPCNGCMEGNLTNYSTGAKYDLKDIPYVGEYT